jgi:hypothetical protein
LIRKGNWKMSKRKLKRDQSSAGEPDTSGVVIGINAVPKGEWKILGGGDRDEWNKRLSNLVTRALPIDQANAESVSKAGSAVAAGVVDTKPANPIEGMLISQIVVANEAAMEFYRRGWANTAAGYFDAGTKYLQLADKSSRTVAILTERLDQHRGRGHQQILVKHVTVNADQAVVTDSDRGKETPGTKLLSVWTAKPLEVIEPAANEVVPVEGGGQK